MSPQEVLYVYMSAFVEELVAAGVRHVCLCPGSRSAPLALMMARQPGLRIWTHIDERSAAFFALGMAKAHREPVALVCTSGTAAANFLPAVAEARLTRVPLVVLTADRPPELRDNGAPQAIDQIHLYGSHAKWFADMALPEASEAALRYARTTAARAVATARTAPAGPVHLNMPFREPLVPVAPADVAGRTASLNGDGAKPNADRVPYVTVESGRIVPSAGTIARLRATLEGAQHGLIIAGPQDDPALPGAVTALAAALGWPVLADPLSGGRRSPHQNAFVTSAYDAFLRDADFAARMAPDVVLRFGAMPTAKPVLLYLQQHAGARQIVVDAAPGWNEPTNLAADMVYADPVALCQELAPQVAAVDSSTSTWTRTWQEADRRTRAAIARELDTVEELTEARVFAELSALLPAGATLYIGNSMPVRDLDTFFPAGDTPVRILGNRGANGIDGVVSSALGASTTGAPTVLVIGDLSFYHDMNGLLAAKAHNLNATIILLNNDGGGIFSFLPQASEREHFELLFGTPTGLDFRPAVEMYGGRFVRPDAWPAFRDAVRQGLARPGLTVVEVRTDRAQNVGAHRAIWPAVAAAVRDLLPTGAAEAVTARDLAGVAR